MPAWVINDRYWMMRYRLRPDEVALLPLEDYLWWPLLDRAEHLAHEREQHRPPEPKQRGGRG